MIELYFSQDENYHPNGICINYKIILYQGIASKQPFTGDTSEEEPFI